MGHSDWVGAFCLTYGVPRDDVEALLEPLRRELAEAVGVAGQLQLMIDGWTGNLDTSRWSELLDEYVKLAVSEPDSDLTEQARQLLVAFYNTLWQTASWQSKLFELEGSTLLVFLKDRARLLEQLRSGRAAPDVE